MVPAAHSAANITPTPTTRIGCEGDCVAG
jgi:hypothetical protein